MKQLTLILIAFIALSNSSCELINKAVEAAPQVFDPKLDLADSALVAYPNAMQIAAWYCPEVIPDPTGILCSPLGPRPQKHEMQFHFELRYLIDNPNNFPVPTTEILAAINVFEGRQTAELGAVCTVLCNEGDFACTGAPGENSCKSDVNDIESIDDLKDRLGGLLILTVDAAINGDLENLLVRSIPAGAERFEVRVRFSLGIDAMIDIMATLVDQLVNDLLAGKGIQFEIPYSVRGTLWFEAPLLGRIALGYGPFKDTWVIEP